MDLATRGKTEAAAAAGAAAAAAAEAVAALAAKRSKAGAAGSAASFRGDTLPLVSALKAGGGGGISGSGAVSAPSSWQALWSPSASWVTESSATSVLGEGS